MALTNNHFSDWLKNPNESSIFLRPTSPNETKSILQSFKNNKASGPNSILQQILNVIDEFLLIFLTREIMYAQSSSIFKKRFP